MATEPRDGVCSATGCGWQLGATRYRFPTPTGYVERCGRCALLYPPLVRSAVKTAAVVGTILTVINHGAALLGGRVGLVLLAEVALTYFVPYAVSTYAALALSRVRVAETGPPSPDDRRAARARGRTGVHTHEHPAGSKAGSARASSTGRSGARV